jgi:hypothetical protein
MPSITAHVHSPQFTHVHTFSFFFVLFTPLAAHDVSMTPAWHQASKITFLRNRNLLRTPLNAELLGFDPKTLIGSVSPPCWLGASSSSTRNSRAATLGHGALVAAMCPWSTRRPTEILTRRQEARTPLPWRSHTTAVPATSALSKQKPWRAPLQQIGLRPTDHHVPRVPKVSHSNWITNLKQKKVRQSVAIEAINQTCLNSATNSDLLGRHEILSEYINSHALGIAADKRRTVLQVLLVLHRDACLLHRLATPQHIRRWEVPHAISCRPFFVYCPSDWNTALGISGWKRPAMASAVRVPPPLPRGNAWCMGRRGEGLRP